MTGRILDRASSFKKMCRYICKDEINARVLYQEGVRGHDYHLMAHDFEMIHSLRPGVGKPVFHAVLNFHRDEQLDDARMVEIARKYLAGIRMTNTQCVIVKHLDTRRTHLHLVANWVDLDGNLIDKIAERLRNKYVIKELAREYGLELPGKKNLRETNFDALDASDTRRYAIYRSIMECLPGCQDMKELQDRLGRTGVSVRFRTDPQTGQRTGISFQYQNEAFRGGIIDRDCTYRQLQKTLEQRQHLAQWENEKLALKKSQAQQNLPAMQEKEEQSLRRQTQKQSEQQDQQQSPIQEEALQQAQRHGYRLRIH